MRDPQRRLKAIGWILVLVAASLLESCVDAPVPVKCGTTGAGGSGPGGCRLDMKFDTSDTLVMPDSPAGPPRASKPPLTIPNPR
jgi:hypothetical protein